MRAIRLSGSAGGGTASPVPPTPIRDRNFLDGRLLSVNVIDVAL